MARGRWLYVSEPYRYGLYNARRGFIPFPSEITVVQPCEDGVYVCADKTYWLPGDPLATTPVVLLPYGALLGSATPEGWLWLNITAAALCIKARLTTSRGYTLVCVSVPWNSSSEAIRRCCASRNSTINTSCCRPPNTSLK